jgi:hypothetical protein
VHCRVRAPRCPSWSPIPACRSSPPCLLAPRGAVSRPLPTLAQRSAQRREPGGGVGAAAFHTSWKTLRVSPARRPPRRRARRRERPARHDGAAEQGPSETSAIEGRRACGRRAAPSCGWSTRQVHIANYLFFSGGRSTYHRVESFVSAMGHVPTVPITRSTSWRGRGVGKALLAP